MSVDTGVELLGDFPPTELGENISGNWASQKTLGLATPILQFVGGEQESIEFEARMFAKHQGVLGTGLLRDDIDEKVGLLKNAVRPNPDLGRPEIFLFSIVSVGALRFLQAALHLGSPPEPQLSIQCVVQSVGGIKYDRPRGDGSLRGATFSLNLLRYEPYSIEALTEAESLVTPAKTGEAYESIAFRVHGDAMLGEALRRRNPDRPILEAGDLVHVPSARILRREITPLAFASLLLKPGIAQRENLLSTLEAHAGSTLSHVLLEDWNV